MGKERETEKERGGDRERDESRGGQRGANPWVVSLLVSTVAYMFSFAGKLQEVNCC